MSEAGEGKAGSAEGEEHGGKKRPTHPGGEQKTGFGEGIVGKCHEKCMSEQPQQYVDCRTMQIARLSWILPLASWGSQIASNVLLRGWAPGEIFLLLMILQGLALAIGAALGVGAIISMAWRGDWQGRKHAVAGCLLSGITIALIVVAFLTQ
ncbi:MAG: hypothetical protein C0404_03455 [Verrucomicrobia bacterium]|nr:hypothetical protein [Verrucomicrobiota bacterium]